MGATHVTVTIRNPALPDKSWEGLFLVDTGAVDSLVPGCSMNFATNQTRMELKLLRANVLEFDSRGKGTV